MVFRRIYWVTEQLDADGKGVVTGVYTSIPDLTAKGLRWMEGGPTGNFRISLVKLDSPASPLGCWSGPEFANFEAEMAPYVQTKEFSTPDIEHLAASLRDFANSSA